MKALGGFEASSLTLQLWVIIKYSKSGNFNDKTHVNFVFHLIKLLTLSNHILSEKLFSFFLVFTSLADGPVGFGAIRHANKWEDIKQPTLYDF